MFKTGCSTCTLLALVSWTANAETIADHSESRSPAGSLTSAEQVKKALEQHITLDLPYQPLTEVIRLLRDQSHINLVLDQQTLSQSSFNPYEAIVSTPLKMRLGSGLRQILSQHNLDYAIIGDMLLITTEQQAIERQMRQPISVRFQRLQLKTALERLAQETATNIVLDPIANPQMRMAVTLSVNDAPLEVIVKLLANQVGLRQIRVGNVMIVTTKANAAELQEGLEFGQVPSPAIDPQMMDLLRQRVRQLEH
jgi:hypothetical protein